MNVVPGDVAPKRQNANVIARVWGGIFLVCDDHQLSEACRNGVRTRTGIAGGGVKICPDHILGNEMTMKTEGWIQPRLMLDELVGSQEDSVQWHDGSVEVVARCETTARRRARGESLH